MNIDLEGFLSLGKHWPYPRGFFAVLIIVILLEIPLLERFGIGFSVAVLVLLISAAFVYGIWWYTRRLPRTKVDKVGFVVSISSDDEKEAKKIRTDFVQTIRRLIKRGEVGASFQFIEVPSFISENVVDIDDAQRLRSVTNSHFVLYGRVRVRAISKIEHYFIELDGIVAHKVVSDVFRKSLSKEFSELLPRKIAISAENDLFAFEFTSEWAEIVAKYIIGIAAALSGDLEYAQRLYLDVRDRVGSKNRQFPIFEKLRQRLPIRIFEISEARANFHYESWVRTKNLEEIEIMGSILSSIEFEKFRRPSIVYLMSIYSFLVSRDLVSAHEWLRKCPKGDRNAVWHLNVAFLHAYQGDLQRASRHYKMAGRLPIAPDVLGKIEDFVVYVASVEPEKYQLFYCLGFFNRDLKGDELQAKTDFEKFLSLGDEHCFEHERAMARRWIDDLKVS